VKVTAASDKVDADALREFTTSMKIEQHKDRVVLTASVPLGLGGRNWPRRRPHRGPSGSGLDATPANAGWTVKTGPEAGGSLD